MDTISYNTGGVVIKSLIINHMWIFRFDLSPLECVLDANDLKNKFSSRYFEYLNVVCTSTLTSLLTIVLGKMFPTHH